MLARAASLPPEAGPILDLPRPLREFALGRATWHDISHCPLMTKSCVRIRRKFSFFVPLVRNTHQAPLACMSAPFPTANEDYYELWSISLRASDSRVVKTHENKVVGFTACLGQLARGQPVQMYATGTVAKVPWIGTGECLALPSQPPVHTVIAFTCHLSLSGLPVDYAGGFKKPFKERSPRAR